MDNVKFAYLEDPKNPHRKVTIARAIDGDNVVFAYCINRCKDRQTDGHFGHSEFTRGVYFSTRVSAHPIDKFDKGVARNMSAGLLKSASAHRIPVVKGEAPHITVLKYLAENDKNSLVKRSCKAYLSQPVPELLRKSA